MIKVGIIGGAGYTAGELIRLLINHPKRKSYSSTAQVTPETKLPTYMKDCTRRNGPCLHRRVTFGQN